MIECQYEQEPFDDEDVYANLMEMMKKIFMMMMILQTRT
jgi:hypothetical protein